MKNEHNQVKGKNYSEIMVILTKEWYEIPIPNNNNNNNKTSQQKNEARTKNKLYSYRKYRNRIKRENVKQSTQKKRKKRRKKCARAQTMGVQMKTLYNGRILQLK